MQRLSLRTRGVFLLLAFLSMGRSSAAEPTVDRNTLMLAHFDSKAYLADYANGWPEFAGSGAHLIEGYYGKAIDLRGIQFEKDFMNTAEGVLPANAGFGIWPRSNMNLFQGTIEFWFKVSPDGQKQTLYGPGLFFTHWHQATTPGETSSMTLTKQELAWQWYTLGKGALNGYVAFPTPLNPDDWHHLAMCWSQGEFTIYVDGRLVTAQDMTDKLGPLFLAAPHSPLFMGRIAMDELRISNVVRYSTDFEPAWRDNVRPLYAFEGIPGIKRYPQKLEEAYIPNAATAQLGVSSKKVILGGMTFVFDAKTGFLKGFGSDGKVSQRNTNGLLLWEGLARRFYGTANASDWRQTKDGLSFRQVMGDGIILQHHLSKASGGAAWEVAFDNQSGKEVWLEALMSLPVAPVKQYFDMSYPQNKLSLPRRVDEYAFSLPFVAAAGGDRSIGLGIDPHIDLAALVSEYIPEAGGATIRQGTKIVLSPKETFKIKWHVFTEAADFLTQNAIAHYHGLFPDLYKQDPAMPVYSYLPISRYQEWLPYSVGDIMRICYSGQQWGHGPGHVKGDEYGCELFWNLPKDKDRADYQEAERFEKVYKSLENLHRLIYLYAKRAYYNDYALRRSHYLPNWAASFIPETLYPEGMLGGDPMTVGQYYYPSMYYANERNTPLGKHYKELSVNIMEAAAQFSPGFINDMCQTSPMRFTDPIARKTPGRAFSRDRGVYVTGGFGHADRYRTINEFQDARGFKQSVWSDAGAVSYQLSSCSASNAIESCEIPMDFTNVDIGLKAARNLLGEKPMDLHSEVEGMRVDNILDAEHTTPEMLRDVFRFMDAQMMLHCFRDGVYLSREALQGRQQLVELNPILVESIASGRKIVDGARVNDPLIVRRSGEGMQSFLAVGNEKPRAVTSSLVVTNRFFGGRPILGAYFGGEVKEKIERNTSTVQDLTVQPRTLIGFMMLGTLSGSNTAQVSSRFSGDGLSMQADLTIETREPSTMRLNTFAPVYQIVSVSVNGTLVGKSSTIKLPRGVSSVRVQYRTPVLPFDSAVWKSVDLIKNGKANFCLITDQPSPSAQHKADMEQLAAPWGFRISNDMNFDNGTANMLNQFLDQYDEEDGVVGNLSRAPIVGSVPAGFDGWKVYIKSHANVTPSRVRIDPVAQAIYVEGKSTGEARRAMVVFLRLVDRKYPHIGRMFDLRYGPGEAAIKRLMFDETKEFFGKIADKDFLIKPILNARLEGLYQNNNMNFEGKYDVRFSPYIYEPTYSDNYVYGYTAE